MEGQLVAVDSAKTFWNRIQTISSRKSNKKEQIRQTTGIEHNRHLKNFLESIIIDIFKDI